jgi:hypothetical protein
MREKKRRERRGKGSYVYEVVLHAFFFLCSYVRSECLKNSHCIFDQTKKPAACIQNPCNPIGETNMNETVCPFSYGCVWGHQGKSNIDPESCVPLAFEEGEILDDGDGNDDSSSSFLKVRVVLLWLMLFVLFVIFV